MRVGIGCGPGVAGGMPRILVVFGHSGGGARAASGPAIADGTSTYALGAGARLLRDEYRDDLRRLRHEADGDVEATRQALQRFPQLGPVGADIFCRAAQAVRPELRPYFDRKALDGAERVDLPADPSRLAKLVG